MSAARSKARRAILDLEYQIARAMVAEPERVHELKRMHGFALERFRTEYGTDPRLPRSPLGVRSRRR